MMACSCGYQPADDGPPTWSSAWHREHRDHHVAVFDADAGTVRVLDECVARAEELEASTTHRPLTSGQTGSP